MKRKLALIASSIIAVTGCSESGKDLTDFPTSNMPNNSNYVKADPSAGISNSDGYNDYGVHDPSIVKVNDTYYIFGSHLAAAKSTDLINWQEVSSLTDGNVDTSPLFDTYSTEISEGIAWTDNFSGNWAANVIQAPNGKFWFYYNHCGQDNPDTADVVDEVCWHRSYLGLAEADSIEGPYVDKGIFLRSGHRDGELATYPVDGVTEYNPAIHPNTIDPTTFYDKDGGLWMVYGSYSGGIFVLDIDETTGMPVAGQGYGQKLVGGDFNAMEGPYAFYSPESDYYYLMWSNGGFADGEGYNVRVARSKTPNGPYLDAEGNDVVNARINNNMGVKLIGSFNFDSPLGELATEWGYNAPGHNSVMYDEDLGKHLFVAHTRFPVEQQPHANAHAVRVHEMWVNEDGWLVLSPHRYAPVNGENYVDQKDIEGDYRIIFHGKDTNGEEYESTYIKLQQGNGIFTGNITGSVSGTYELQEDNSNLEINIDGVTYKGVAKWQWNVGDERLEPVISAMSPTGEMLWAQQLEAKTEAQVIADVQAAIAAAIPSEDTLLTGGSLDLVTTGPRGVEISWTSSAEAFVRQNGDVNRPGSSAGNQQVELTATISYGSSVQTHVESVRVKALSEFNRVAAFSFEDTLAENGVLAATGISYDDGIAATDVTGASTATAVFVDGQEGNGRALNLDTTYGVLLDTDLIASSQYTVSFWLNQQTNAQFVPALFAANSLTPAKWLSFLPESWNGGLMAWSRNDETDVWFDAQTYVPGSDPAAVLVYPDNEWHHIALAYDAGRIEIMYDGELVGTASGLFDVFTNKPDGSILTLGLNYWDGPLHGYIDELNFYDAALSAAEIKAIEIDNITSVDTMLEIAQSEVSIPADLSSVTSDLNLAGTGAFASSITWTSSNPDVISTVGKVTRPGREAEQNVDVTLTATIELNGSSVTKEFVASVVPFGPPRPIARFSFEGDLSDSTGNFADGQAAVRGLVASDAAMIYDTGAVGDAFSIAGGNSAGAKLPNNLITDHTYSFALWLKPNSLNQFTPTFFGAAADNSWISLVPFGPGSGNTMLWSGTAWFDGDSTIQIPVDTWTHLAVTVDSGSLAIYINGELVNQLDGFPDVFTAAATSQFALGINYWDTSFDGLIDELVIFSEPVTVTEIKALYDEADLGQ